jgi:UDPglucose 6-dehydrogenase
VINPIVPEIVDAMASLSHPAVRNVCFIGAGYVGTFSSPLAPRPSPSILSAHLPVANVNLGGPTAAVIALYNREVTVTVVDKDAARIARWNSQHPPIYEPGLQEILRITRDGTNTYQFNQNRGGNPPAEISQVTVGRPPNLFFTTDMEKSAQTANIIFICVSTPTRHEGEGAGSATDMTAFETVAAFVAAHAQPGVIIVEKSTVPCGTADAFENVVSLPGSRNLTGTNHGQQVKRSLPGLYFDVLSNPEFLAAGTAIHDLLYPARVLIGSARSGAGQRASQILGSLYNWVPRDRIITTDYFSSELAKVAANAMLAQRVSSINSIAAICDAKGADVDEVALALGADDRIGPEYLRAGIGFGGSCFKKDVLSLVHLANSLDLEAVGNYWLAVLEMNSYAKHSLVTRLFRGLDGLVAGKKITVLGYAFKHNTNDTRESPVHDIIRGLTFRKPSEIAIFDPCCPTEHIEQEIDNIHGFGMATAENGRVSVYQDVQRACRGAHAVVLTTEFRDFEYEASQMSSEASIRQKKLADPRPFRGAWPTEAELLSLHYFLQQCPDKPAPSAKEDDKPDPSSSQKSGKAVIKSQESGWDSYWHLSPSPPAPVPTSDDPLGQFNPMPPCQKDCPDCREEKNKAEDKGKMPNKKLNWKDVHASMQAPYLVFDGRGVLDIARMQKMGFKVVTVGRQSRAEWHKKVEPVGTHSWI